MTEEFIETRYIRTEKYPFKHLGRLLKMKSLPMMPKRKKITSLKTIYKLWKHSIFNFEGIVGLYKITYPNSGSPHSSVVYKVRGSEKYIPKKVIEYTMPKDEFKEKYPEELI